MPSGFVMSLVKGVGPQHNTTIFSPPRFPTRSLTLASLKLSLREPIKCLRTLSPFLNQTRRHLPQITTFFQILQTPNRLAQTAKTSSKPLWQLDRHITQLAYCSKLWKPCSASTCFFFYSLSSSAHPFLISLIRIPYSLIYFFLSDMFYGRRV